MNSKVPEIDWAALETDIDATGEFRPPAKTAAGKDAKIGRFPCAACGGTGRYLGVRRHQAESRCFACGGKGYFMMSERDREKARQGRQERKARQLAETRAVFDAQFPDVAPALAAAAGWSAFAADLLNRLTQYGSLSEPQVAAVRRMAEKAAARRTERAAERAAGNTTVDLSPIRAMFESAVGNGYKRPMYRAAGLVISRAPDHGRNPGALYVKSEDGNYLGKILGTEYTGRPAAALQAIAADPRGEAVRWGQRTGRCSCCGRELTVESSIESGIGPVCATMWGL